MTDERRSNIQQFLDIGNVMLQRRERARSAFEKEPEEWVSFAFVGMRANFEVIDIENGVRIQRIKEAPGQVEVAGALLDKSLLSTVSRYSEITSFEYGVRRDLWEDLNEILSMAWCFIAGIRLASESDFIVPMFANRSWNLVAGVPEDSLVVQMLEDYPKARRFDPHAVVTQRHCEWALENLNSLVGLTREPSFEMALEALTTHHLQSDLRMVIAMLWAGLDALFDEPVETTFRVSSQLAAFLYPIGTERLECFEGMKKLSRVRGKAVHGKHLSIEEMQEHVISVRKLLTRTLRKIVEDGGMPSRDRLNRLLFVGE